MPGMRLLLARVLSDGRIPCGQCQQLLIFCYSLWAVFGGRKRKCERVAIIGAINSQHADRQTDTDSAA